MKEYVWYAGYGSNLFKDRFFCYIKGGRPEGSKTTETGCRDNTLPIRELPVTLNYELYFAKKSTRWGGGIGFIRINKDKENVAYANMYLITKEQFCDVVKQETKSDENVNIDFNLCIKKGGVVFKPGSTYGNLIYVGTKDEYPIFTFTNEKNLEATKPSLAYLKMIAAGLVASHKLTQNQIIDFLLARPGVTGNYTREELTSLP